MAAVVKLRIILGENDSWRLASHLERSKSIRELDQQIKGQCGVNGDIWL